MTASTCPKCGAPRRETDKFCHFCGTALSAAPAAPASQGAGSTIQRPAQVAQHTDQIGLVSLGFLLLTVSVVFLSNPGIFSHVIQWAERIGQESALARPPQGLIESAILFFVLVALFAYVTAVLRFAASRMPLRALADAFGATGTLAFAYLLGFYERRELSAAAVLAFEAAVVGVLIIAYVAITVYLNRRWWRARAAVPQPAERKID